MKLTNTLSGNKDIFVPIDRKNVRFYSCGPTVYDNIHIGNARALIISDVLFRLLSEIYGKNSVKYVRNITDIDDKIIKRSNELEISEMKLVEKTIKNFHEDCNFLNCLQPTFEPRVSEEIDSIILLIQKLLHNKHAYELNGDVLFDVNSFSDYGKLSRRKIADQISGTRKIEQIVKKNDLDFILWKKNLNKNDISWNSPWGNGRPGWHIECSAMSHKYLGEDFDIHAGGVDLKFPHHENEIAQSFCGNIGSTFAKYWVHNGFLTVNGEKMSKSLGNFITVKSLKEMDFYDNKLDGKILRFALMSSDYKKPLDYTEKVLMDSSKQLLKFNKFIEKVEKISIPKEAIDILSDDLNFIKYNTKLNEWLKIGDFEKLAGGMELIGIR